MEIYVIEKKTFFIKIKIIKLRPNRAIDNAARPDFKISHNPLFSHICYWLR